MNDQLNINRIKAVYFALGELKEKGVFVGGATVALYATRTTYEIRPTDDVDILVEVYTRPEYAKLEEQLRSMGFKNDTTAKFVGRFIIQGITVDVMPIFEDVLGFKNKWYPESYEKAIDHTIDDQCTVKYFRHPIFWLQNWKHLSHEVKTRRKNMTDGQAQILKTWFMSWRTGVRYGKKWLRHHPHYATT